MIPSNLNVVLSRAFGLLCAVVAFAALYLGRDLLLPVALAILLSFLLAPLVRRLEKWYLGRVPSVILVVAVVFSVMGILGYVLGHQIYDLAQRLPEYKDNIAAKLEPLQARADSLARSMSDVVEETQQKVEEQTGADVNGSTSAPLEPGGSPSMGTTASDSSNEGNGPAGNSQAGPTQVEVVDKLSAPEIAQRVLGPVVPPLATAAMVVVLVIFMLIERESLRDRVLHIVAPQQLNLATKAIDDAASRVSRYLRMQFIVNAIFGSVIAIGLYFIGLPNALLWGVLAAALRFLPYIGPWIAAALPIALAAAVFPGWTQPVLVIGLFIVNELISNNILEPWLYGSSTGISPLAIILSAIFWTWLWGPVGLVLATPLTVCLTVLGRYVPELSFLYTLLSDEEVLTPESRFYQRLLALDPEEATDFAEEYLESHSLESLYDRVFLPALSMAEHDRHQGNLDEDREKFILRAVRELIEDFGSRPSVGTKPEDAGSEDGDTHPSESGTSLLCLPARDEADEIVGLMLAQLLKARGAKVDVVSAQTLRGEMLAQVPDDAQWVVCVSALPPLAATHARYLCKRLRVKAPALKIVVGLWQTPGSTEKAQSRLLESGMDRLVTSLGEASQFLSQAVASAELIKSAADPASEQKREFDEQSEPPSRMAAS